jgi:hypothetical protein
LQDTLLALPATAISPPGALRHRSCRPPLIARTTPIGCTRRDGGTAGGSQPTRARRAAGAGQRSVDVPPATRRFADERRDRPQRSAVHARVPEALARSLAVAGDRSGARRIMELVLSRPGPCTAAWCAVDPHYAALRR